MKLHPRVRGVLVAMPTRPGPEGWTTASDLMRRLEADQKASVRGNLNRLHHLGLVERRYFESDVPTEYRINGQGLAVVREVRQRQHRKAEWIARRQRKRQSPPKASPPKVRDRTVTLSQYQRRDARADIQLWGQLAAKERKASK